MSEEDRLNAWIQTRGGKKIHFLNPDPAAIDLLEIATALSRTGRFANQSTNFYSVAQHSVFVSSLVEQRGGSRFQMMVGLLHDAPEAFTGDLPKPLKRLLPGINEIESALWDAVCKKLLGGQCQITPLVKLCDEIALATEARDIFAVPPLDRWTDRLPPAELLTIVPIPSDQARALFLDRFNQLERILA
jgi:5'-deoxynucleotidase YfbR-like HD superfamily hydrolase